MVRSAPVSPNSRQKITPEKKSWSKKKSSAETAVPATVTSDQRERSKELLDQIRQKVSKSKRRSKEKRNLKIVAVPDAIMVSFIPRTFWPWGFDGCGDGNARFQLPGGYEYDTRMSDLVDELNAVPKPGIVLANLVTVFGLLCMVGIFLGSAIALTNMVPVMVIAHFFTVLIGLPLVLSARFRLKADAIASYINRLTKQLGDRGVVHWEALHFSLTEVWTRPFVGHRTGLLERTAVACELWLPNKAFARTVHRNSISQAFASPQEYLEQEQAKVANAKAVNHMRNQDERIAFANLLSEVNEQRQLHRVVVFLEEIGMGKLTPIVRRHRLTLEKMEKLTEMGWRDMGIPRTDMKLVKLRLHEFAEKEKEVLREEARKLEYIRQMNQMKKKAEVAANPTMWHGGKEGVGGRVLAPAGAREDAPRKMSVGKTLSSKVVSAASFLGSPPTSTGKGSPIVGGGLSSTGLSSGS